VGGKVAGLFLGGLEEQGSQGLNLQAGLRVGIQGWHKVSISLPSDGGSIPEFNPTPRLCDLGHSGTSV
jgi:hypothetical protein